ncbi:MAG: HD family phosphohydrolase [Desulfuromonas sp.]|nr:MAG: HD family phosphohydrolase [Desulfuromonas sp.]
MSDHRQQALLDFIRHLASAVTTASIYPLEHKQVGSLCAQALDSILTAIDKDSEISLKRVDDQMILGGKPLGGGMYPIRLASMLKHRGIGHLKISRFVEQQEILNLIAALSRKDKSEIHSTENVRLGKLELRYNPSEGAEAESTGNEGEAVKPDYADLSEEQLDRLMEIYEATKKQKKLHSVGISEIVSSFIASFTRESNPLLALAPLRQMDEYTFTHSINVCVLNLAQASALGIEGALLHDIGIAALLHDVGKIQVPTEILNKKEKLTDDDWKIIKNHPIEGAKFLINAPGVPRLAVVTAYEHHFRFDASGYPTRIGKREQNISSHMTALSDMFDAMLTHRPYSAASELSEVATTMKYMGGTQLHPLLTENFMKIIKKYYPDLDIA